MNLTRNLSSHLAHDGIVSMKRFIRRKPHTMTPSPFLFIFLHVSYKRAYMLHTANPQNSQTKTTQNPFLFLDR